MSREVRRISAEQHSEFLDGVIASGSSSVSFLQLPEWGGVKVGWRPESVGWFEESTPCWRRIGVVSPRSKIATAFFGLHSRGPGH